MVDLIVQNYGCLGTQALEACEDIIAKGFRLNQDGTLGKGTNEEFANMKATDFGEWQIDWLKQSGNPLFQKAGSLIELRQIYAMPAPARDAFHFDGKYTEKANAGKRAQMKYVIASMRQMGWKSDARFFGERLIGDKNTGVSAQVSLVRKGFSHP